MTSDETGARSVDDTDRTYEVRLKALESLLTAKKLLRITLDDELADSIEEDAEQLRRELKESTTDMD